MLVKTALKITGGYGQLSSTRLAASKTVLKQRLQRGAGEASLSMAEKREDVQPEGGLP